MDNSEGKSLEDSCIPGVESNQSRMEQGQFSGWTWSKIGNSCDKYVVEIYKTGK